MKLPGTARGSARPSRGTALSSGPTPLPEQVPKGDRCPWSLGTEEVTTRQVSVRGPGTSRAPRVCRCSPQGHPPSGPIALVHSAAAATDPGSLLALTPPRPHSGPLVRASWSRMTPPRRASPPPSQPGFLKKLVDLIMCCRLDVAWHAHTVRWLSRVRPSAPSRGPFP